MAVKKTGLGKAGIPFPNLMYVTGIYSSDDSSGEMLQCLVRVSGRRLLGSPFEEPVRIRLPFSKQKVK